MNLNQREAPVSLQCLGNIVVHEHTHRSSSQSCMVALKWIQWRCWQSDTHWSSRQFHVEITLSKKKYSLRSSREQFFCSFKKRKAPLVRPLLSNSNETSNGRPDNPRTTVLYRFQSYQHDEMHAESYTATPADIWLFELQLNSYNFNWYYVNKTLCVIAFYFILFSDFITTMLCCAFWHRSY